MDKDNILLTEQHYSRVLDLIGPAAIQDTLRHMTEDSIVCITGLLGGVWTMDNFDPLEDLPANSYLTSVESKNVSEEKMNHLLKFIQQYRINVRPEKVFSLDQIREAHTYLEDTKSFGKVVVLP